jgi:hypothetical protein
VMFPQGFSGEKGRRTKDEISCFATILFASGDGHKAKVPSRNTRFSLSLWENSSAILTCPA